MKKIFGFWNLMLLVTGSLFIVSCGDDTDPIDGSTPTLKESHTFDASKGQDPSQPVVITLTGTKATAELLSITVQENGVNLDPSRFKVDNDVVASSVVALLGADKQGFTKTVSITLPPTTATYTYKFTLTDVNQKSDAVSLDIKVEGVTTVASEKMYNYLGPLAGGLDLLTGKAVTKGTDANNEWASAHIRDAGNNNPGGNVFPWKAAFIPWKGSVVRKTTNANWEATVSKNQIKTFFDAAGSDIAEAKMTAGDVFAVKNGTNYWLIKVKNLVDDGDTNNGDYSEFDIKQ